MQVPIDWFKTLLFGRDISRFWVNLWSRFRVWIKWRPMFVKQLWCVWCGYDVTHFLSVFVVVIADVVQLQSIACWVCISLVNVWSSFSYRSVCLTSFIHQTSTMCNCVCTDIDLCLFWFCAATVSLSPVQADLCDCVIAISCRLTKAVALFHMWCCIFRLLQQLSL